MSSTAIYGAIQLGLLYGLVALAVLFSFRMLNFPDLTVDGSFPLGAAACAATIVWGGGPFVGLLVAVLVGGISGVVTAFLSHRLGILDLLAGLITMTALYSINIRIMGRPNIPLIGEDTVILRLTELGFSTTGARFVVTGFFCFSAIVVSGWFLSSKYGLSLRAVGVNRRMAASVGVSVENRIYVGLAVSNGLAALAGGLFAQIYGFADVSMGIGTIVIGLAAVILGETFARNLSPVSAVLACVIGAIIYRFTISLALQSEYIGLTTSDLNAISAAFVTVAFILSSRSRRAHLKVKS